MTPDTVTIVAHCGQFSFDSLPLAVEFLRMLAHEIKPQQFFSMVMAVTGSQDAVTNAHAVAAACLGTTL